MEEDQYYDHEDTLLSKYYSDHDGDDDGDYDDDSDDIDDFHYEECDSDSIFDAKKRRPLYLAILRDDVPEFVLKLKSLFDLDDLDEDAELVEPKPRLCPTFVVKSVFLHRALKCFMALLQGQTCVFVDLNIPFHNGIYPLYLAAKWLDCNMVELFLTHGAQADVKNEITMESNSLPLQAALESLHLHLFLYDWTPEESIHKLVIILCLPQMKVVLETSRLLAWNTKHVNELFINYAKEGKLMEMAVLLLVANELVMAPTSFQNKDFTIRHTKVSQVMGDILSQADEESDILAFNGEKRSKLDLVCKGKRAAFTLILLKIFEKAGDALKSYLRSRQSQVVPKEEVVKSVVTILTKAGFSLKKRDMDLSNIDCECNKIKRATGTSENITEYNSERYYYMIRQSHSYFRAKRRKELVVVKDVASILKEAGFVFKGKDIDLTSNVDWVPCDSEGDDIKEAARSVYKSEKDCDTLPGLLDDIVIGKLNSMGWPPEHKVYPAKVVKSSSSSKVWASHSFRPLKSFAVFQYQKNQIKGGKNAIQRRMLPSPSSRLLASHAYSHLSVG